MILDQHLSRIQQPTDSGDHSLINQQVPKSAAAATPKPAAASVPGEIGVTTNLIRVPGWLRSIGRIMIAVSMVGCAVMLTGSTSGVGIGPTEFLTVSLIGAWPLLMGAFLCRRQMTREALLAVLFLGLGPLGLFIYLFVSEKLEPAAALQEVARISRCDRIFRSAAAVPCRFITTANTNLPRFASKGNKLPPAVITKNTPALKAFSPVFLTWRSGWLARRTESTLRGSRFGFAPIRGPR